MPTEFGFEDDRTALKLIIRMNAYIARCTENC